MRERSYRLLAVLVAVVASLSALPAAAQPAARRCETREHRQFDFWIGQWEVFDRGGTTKVADVRVDAILDGCVLKEEYSDPDGLHGSSFSSYDVTTRRWQQTWVTNRGQLLVINGALEGQALVFSGWRHDGPKEVLVRARWIPDGAGVRETAETSVDGGHTWTPWFDLDFRRKR
jgi:hypothetical protein